MSDFKEMFLNNTPMLDLRAPIEFSQGAFPNATNIPLLSDKERELIGTCYKQQGQDKAVELGHEIVNGANKSNKIKAWKNYFQENPNACLYCFRGGMRSHLVQEWLKNEGVDAPFIKGGYKAIRSYLIKVLEQPLNLMRISGKTGVGKTDLLVQLEHMIDLEGLAHHRGSAFGKYVKQQPSQINFENNLAIEILQRHQENQQAIIVEDEGRYIGSINLPMVFIESMKNSPVTILTCSTDDRLDRIYQDYVVMQKSDYIDVDAENGANLFDESLLQALEKIKKRLGGARFKQLNQTMQSALKQESETLHKQWIADLLEFYYDPMYQYQMDKKIEKTIYTGKKDDLQKYLTFRLKNLSVEETQVVHQCMRCVANGEIVPDDGEFSVLFGIEMKEFNQIYHAWPNIDENNKKVNHAINDALNNVLGYPHDKHDKWHEVMETPLSTIEKTFMKWRV